MEKGKQDLQRVQLQTVLLNLSQIFLIEGLITTIFGLILLFFVPEDPSKSKLLTPEERALAVARIDADRIVKSQGQLEKTTWKLVWRSFNIMVTEAVEWGFSLRIADKGMGRRYLAQCAS